MANISFTYQTLMPVQDCIKNLLLPPLHFTINKLFSRDYMVERISESEIAIIFTTGYNLSNHRTEYLACSSRVDNVTFVNMKFVSEKGGFPFPFVTDYEISKLFKARIDAEIMK